MIISILQYAKIKKTQSVYNFFTTFKIIIINIFQTIEKIDFRNHLSN